MTMTSAHPDWWRGAVIYQIYPRSYQDSNADGVGDLPGITRRLPHVAALGVDAVWLSPFYPSPMKDFGYDVADYRDVDPLFGTLDDFREMVRAAHALGLRVLVDVVFSHTSDRHPWFAESRAGRGNPKADWYVWADAKPDGSPPNNWLSVFGGSAWEWDGGRRQYYLHNFLAAQPDLNFHNRAVQDELLDITRFWLELGVDGFRMDTVNFYFHAESLQDNPPLYDGDGVPDSDNPYDWQQHLYDKSQPENLEFLKRFRALLDEYPGATAVGEVGAKRRGLEVVAAYTGGGDKVHMCYAFDFLSATRPDRENVRAAFARLSNAAPDAWACWAFSNHDVIRHATRWRAGGDGDEQNAWLRLLCGLLLSLRGSVCIYQGEELGLTEAAVARGDLQDPYGIRFWPAPRGRDGCRTPMVWERAKAHGGFTDAPRPWLPAPAEHFARAVDAQDPQTGLLAHYKRFIAFRKQHAALAVGSIRFLEFAGDGDGDVLAFVREHDGESLACVFNLGAQTATVNCDAFTGAQSIDGHGFTGALTDGELCIDGYNAWFGKLS